MIITGKGHGLQPNSKLNGRTTVEGAEYAFTLVIGAAARLDLTGANAFRTNSAVKTEVFFASGEYSGESVAIGHYAGQDNTGRWEGRASITKRFLWPDLAPQTLLLAFGSERRLY